MPTPKSSAVSKAAPIELSDSDDLFVVRSNKEPALPEVAVPASESGEEPVAATSIVQPVSYSSEGRRSKMRGTPHSLFRVRSRQKTTNGSAPRQRSRPHAGCPAKLSNDRSAYHFQRAGVSDRKCLFRNVPTLPDITHESPICETDFAASTTALTIPIYMGGRVLNMIGGAGDFVHTRGRPANQRTRPQISRADLFSGLADSLPLSGSPRSGTDDCRT